MDAVDKLKKSFETDVVCTSDLFVGYNNFVIPPYQRYYSWNDENILKLLDDIYQCINVENISENRNYSSIYSFIGTIIAVKCDVNSSPEFLNENQGKEPPMLYCLIDGQQRITTLQLIATVIISRLYYLKYELSDITSKTTLVESLAAEIQYLLNKYKGIVLQTNGYGNELKSVPKLFRVPDDYYDLKKHKEKYTSVVGQYLSSFINKYFCGDNEDVVSFNERKNKSKAKNSFFDYPSKSVNNIIPQLSENKEQADCLRTAVKCIENYIDNFCLSASDLNDSLRVNVKENSNAEEQALGLTAEQIYTVIKSEDLFNKGDFSDSTIESLKESFLAHDGLLQVSFELIILAKCFLNNVVFTFVKVSSEDYGFSMFDSLNTTGEVLTAYETFKAKVISRTKNYSDSKTKSLIESIDTFLNKANKADKKSATENLLISFARETNGSNVGKKLNKQRNFLNNLVGLSTSSEYLQNAVGELYIASSFWENIWGFDFKESRNLSFQIHSYDNNAVQTINFDVNTTICMALLKLSKHTIVAAPITRFLSFCYKNISDKDLFKKSVDNLQSAIRAITACSCIYRIAKGGTEGIDSIYKDLFAGKEKVDGMCWLDSDSNSKSSDTLLESLKTCLKKKLKLKNMDEMAIWQNQAKDVPTYKKAGAFATFMLIYYWSRKQESDLDISDFSVKPELVSYLVDDLDRTIEHIAPQAQPKDSDDVNSWNREIYNKPDYCHNLGNLLLLDRNINSILSDRNPNEKVALYEFFAEVPEKRKVDILKKNITTSSIDNLDEKKKLPQQYLLKHFDIREIKNWGIQKIESRLQEITSVVWPILEHYLK